MTRLGILVFSAAALTACGGLPPTIHPLLIARPVDSTAPDPAAPAITIEMNSFVLRLPASTLPGCAALEGKYVRQGSKVEVQLRRAATNATCDGPPRPFTTRVGPVPPGSYDVTVMLDGKPLVRAERATIS